MRAVTQGIAMSMLRIAGLFVLSIAFVSYANAATDITITATGSSTATCSSGTCSSNLSTSVLTTADLQSALSAGNVNVDATTGSGSGSGTITWSDGTVGANSHSLTLTAASITINGNLTVLTDVAFSGATPFGSGSLTGTGAITGLGSTTFNLNGTQSGTAGGISFGGFTSTDAATITSAAGFDDAAKSSEGMTFANATSVNGSGTIANVAGSFADNARISTASGIAYSGFGAVTGTGGSVTGATGSFDLGTQVSAASGIDYSGFGVTTLAGSGSGATIAGSAQSYMLDNVVADKGSSGGVSWTAFGNIDDTSGIVSFGSAGTLSGNVTAATLNYGYATPVAVRLSGPGTTGVGGALSGVSTIIATSNLDIGGTTAGALAMSAPNVIDSSSFSFGNGSTASSVTGNYSQTGTLNLHAIATNADHLGITGNANLGGTLSVAFSPPPPSGGGLLAVVLSAGGNINGTFSTFNVSGLLPSQTAKLIYNAHSVQISVEQTQSITNFAATPANPTYAPGGTFTVSATGGGSVYPVVFSIAPASASVCSAGGTNGSTITMLAVGTCTVLANQADDGAYAAAPQVSLSVTIAQATQTITNFIANPASPTYSSGGTFTVSATGGGSGNPVTFTSATTGVCTAGGTNGATITMVNAGTCVLHADQTGNTNYAAATQASLNVTIAQAAQTITNFIANPASPTYSSGGTFTVSATGGGSGNPVTFTSATTGVCTAGGTNGATITMVNAGTCVLHADQTGNTNYAAATQASINVTIAQTTQTLSINAPTSIQLADGPATLTATASSGLPVTVTSTTPTICTVSGTAPTFSIALIAAGTCSLTVAQAGDTNNSPVSQNVTIVVAAPVVPTPMLDRRALLLLAGLIGLVALVRARRA